MEFKWGLLTDSFLIYPKHLNFQAMNHEENRNLFFRE